MITHQVLNSQVKEELSRNTDLYLVYRTLFRGYDDEVDAIHNPDVKQHLESQELQILAEAQCILAEISYTRHLL